MERTSEGVIKKICYWKCSAEINEQELDGLQSWRNPIGACRLWVLCHMGGQTLPPQVCGSFVLSRK